jgi:hypothetical protein
MNVTLDPALRARLIELHGTVKAYFEATAVGAGAGYFGAFDALRRNTPLAEAFVGDLQALMDCLERELFPALGGPRAPERPAPAAPQVSINEDETMLLTRLPANVLPGPHAAPGRAPAGRTRDSASTPPLPATAPGPKRAAAAPEPAIIDDGDESLLQEVETDPEIAPTERRPPAPQPKPAKPAPQAKPAPAKVAPEPARKEVPGQGAIAARIAALAQKAKPAAQPAQKAPAQSKQAPSKARVPPRTAPMPQFDETDITSPGFTLDKEFFPEQKSDKKR